MPSKAISIDQIKINADGSFKGLDEVRLYNGKDALYCKEGFSQGLLGTSSTGWNIVSVTGNNGVPAVNNANAVNFGNAASYNSYLEKIINGEHGRWNFVSTGLSRITFSQTGVLESVGKTTGGVLLSQYVFSYPAKGIPQLQACTGHNHLGCVQGTNGGSAFGSMKGSVKFTIGGRDAFIITGCGSSSKSNPLSIVSSYLKYAITDATVSVYVYHTSVQNNGLNQTMSYNNLTGTLHFYSLIN